MPVKKLFSMTKIPESSPTESLLDFNTLRHIKPSLFNRLLILFEESVPDMVQQIRNAWESGQIQLAGKLTHNLKGSCLAIGASRMTDLCKQAQNQFTEAVNPEFLPLLVQMEHTFVLTLKELKQHQASL
ncbi:MAG: Hpt domain-containing protein [SAR324 cluster bacterium]|nr:Hpt domain-containing protein [SAR324 cluster bacterium]